MAGEKIWLFNFFFFFLNASTKSVNSSENWPNAFKQTAQKRVSEWATSSLWCYTIQSAPLHYPPTHPDRPRPCDELDLKSFPLGCDHGCEHRPQDSDPMTAELLPKSRQNDLMLPPHDLSGERLWPTGQLFRNYHCWPTKIVHSRFWMLASCQARRVTSQWTKTTKQKLI